MNKRQERYKAIEIVENEIVDKFNDNKDLEFNDINLLLNTNLTWKSESDKIRHKIFLNSWKKSKWSK